MKNKILIGVLLFMTLLSVACDSGSSSKKEKSPSQPEESADTLSLEGMIRISASDEEVVLGTNSSGAKSNEKPEMRVLLDYDYYMDVHEATCGDYKSLKSFLGDNRYSCDGDSLPLVRVTFYDAVLFANARSNRDDFDTVYSYTNAEFDKNNHCVYLEGLNSHLDRSGYRLPTEAEWVRAASADWNAKNGWTADNSGYEAHNVCSKGTDSLGFCDFAGNVMEWVNDWLVNFKDTSVVNFVGGSDGGAIGERVLKGGSFRDSRSTINLYRRGDVYAVTSISSSDYVGFRLALGRIDEPLWMNENGSVEKSLLNVVSSIKTLKSIVGSYNVKLAFRNDETGNLAFVDYADGGDVVEVEDTLDVYHPEISPNGSHVAFCTLFEGVDGKSRVYVQDLDETGSNRVLLDVESAAIPRWHVDSDGDTSIIYVSNAGGNGDSAEWKSFSTWIVPFGEGKFGAPKKLFDGSYHGGVSEDRRLAVSGSTLLRTLSMRDDYDEEDVWLNGEQACNVSMVKDGSKRVLFLDFGSKTGRDFVGEKYGVHKYILIADSLGNLIHSVKSPSLYSFDHSEWATDGNNSYIIATLTNSNGAHKTIALVDPVDGAVTELVEGEELWHPNLWLKRVKDFFVSEPMVPADSLVGSDSTGISDSLSVQDSLEITDSTNVPNIEIDLDSAGIYYLPGGNDSDVISRYKMEFLWKYRDSASVVIIGSSRAYYGIDPTEFSDDFFAVNLAVSANNLAGSKFIFDNYVLAHMSKMKYLIVSLDLDRGYNDLETSSYYMAYKKYSGYEYDESHEYWQSEVPDGLAQATYESPGVSRYANMLRSTRGHESKKKPNGWGGDEPSVATDSCWFDLTPELYYDNFDRLVDMIKKAAEKDVYVIGVIFPMAPGFKNTGAYGYHGLRRSLVPDLIKELADIHDSYPNFILFDENKMGDHDYTDDMALDNNHLVHAGAVQMTARLDSLLKTLE